MSALLHAVWCSVAAVQEPVAEVVLERGQAEVGQSVALTIRVRARLLADVEIDDAPLLALHGEDLEVAVRSPAALEQRAAGSGLRFEYRQEYALRARAAGEWSIPALEVRIEELGKTLRTQPVAFAAHLSGDRAGPGVELLLRGPREPVFVGQWFWLTLEAETGPERGSGRFDPGILESSELFDVHAEPPPEGASSWPVRWIGRRVAQLSLVPEEAGAAPNRRRWRARLRLRAREGALETGPALSIAASLEVRPEASSPGGPADSALATCELRVRPLPEEGRPDSFRGAVGQFQLKASLRDERHEPHGSFEVSVEVIGTPPPDAAALPDLTEIPRFLHHGRRDQLAGDRRRAVFTMADRRGEAAAVPGMEWSFFDPERGRYESRSVGPFALRRRVGVDESPASDAASDRPPWLPAILAAAAVAALLLGSWGRRRARRAAPPARPAAPLVPRPDLGALAEAGSPLALQGAWHRVLAAVLGVPAEELAAADLGAHLRGRDPALRRAVLDVQRRLEDEVYGGAGTDLGPLRERALEAGRALLADPGDPDVVPGPDPVSGRR